MGLGDTAERRFEAWDAMSKRYCLTLDLKDDPRLIAEYKKHHERVWPEILESIKSSGIENSSTKNHRTITEFPTEILTEIFSNLDFASQICLGLTCKSLGGVLELVGLNYSRNTVIL